MLILTVAKAMGVRYHWVVLAHPGWMPAGCLSERANSLTYSIHYQHGFMFVMVANPSRRSASKSAAPSLGLNELQPSR
jgi:hypothetical protein